MRSVIVFSVHVALDAAFIAHVFCYTINTYPACTYGQVYALLRGQRSDLAALLRPVPPPPAPSADSSDVLATVSELLADQQTRDAQHQQRQQRQQVSELERHQQLAVRLLDKLGTDHRSGRVDDAQMINRVLTFSMMC